MVSPRAAAITFKKNNESEQRALTKRREAAQAEGRRLAKKILQEHPETLRVWGFGSTYEIWRHYRLDSDIDVAAERGSAYELLKSVETSDFKVDVISMEEIPASLAGFIRQQGTVLAEVEDGR